MIFTRRFLLIWGCGLAPFLLVLLLWPGGGRLLAAVVTLVCYDLVLAAIALLDWRSMEDPRQWEATRTIPPRLSLGEEHVITIRLRLPVGRSLRLVIRDEHPDRLELLDQRDMIRVTEPDGPGWQRAEARYRLRAGLRGDFFFGDILLRWSSPRGLVIRQSRFPAVARCKVYPNIAQAQRHGFSGSVARQFEPGLHRSRLSGQGREFESLREYVMGDELRQVSWTATARRGRLMTRQYQIERNQSVIVMVDIGRLMTSRIAGATKLDHAIDAALSIACAAAGSGDNVGLLVFEREVVRFLPPRKGQAQIRAMLDALYDIEPRMIEPSYARAFQYLTRNCRKRSLVVVLTDLVDRDASADLLACASTLLPRHLPLIVTIADNDLEAIVSTPPDSIDELYRQSVAEELLQQREEALARIVDYGGLALDLPAGSLSVRLVRKYLDVKERGIL